MVLSCRFWRAVERYHAFAGDNEMVDGAACAALLYEKPKS